MTENPKRRMHRKQRAKCFYCSRLVKVEDATLDHVQPVSKGGDNSVHNKVVCCGLCNQCKADRSLEQWIYDLVHAKRQLDLQVAVGKRKWCKTKKPA